MAKDNKKEKSSEKKSEKTSDVRPQGSVIEPAGARLPNGNPNLSPTAGYDGHAPVQFSDESDEMFAGRVAMFNSALANARQIENGGMTFEAEMTALDARYEAEKLNLEKQRDSKQLR